MNRHSDEPQATRNPPFTEARACFSPLPRLTQERRSLGLALE